MYLVEALNCTNFPYILPFFLKIIPNFSLTFTSMLLEGLYILLVLFLISSELYFCIFFRQEKNNVKRIWTFYMIPCLVNCVINAVHINSIMIKIQCIIQIKFNIVAISFIDQVFTTSSLFMSHCCILTSIVDLHRILKFYNQFFKFLRQILIFYSSWFSVLISKF